MADIAELSIKISSDAKAAIDELKKLAEIMEKNAASAMNFGKDITNAENKLNELTNEVKDTNKHMADGKTDEMADGLDDVADSSKGAGDGLDDAGDKAEKSGGKFEKMGGIIKGSVAALGGLAIAAGAAAFKMGKEVIASFGELEQNLGGSEAVFGEYAKSIQKSGEDAYKNLGVSQSEYLATANKMGALFQGSGLDQVKSLNMTEKAMQRAADMASVMGIDMSVALEAVTGAAKGNFTMMDNLGVAMNATSIEAYAAGKGMDFVFATASQAEKSEMAMQMFFENTSQYAGNFAKESTETVTGSMGLMQAAFSSWTAGLGNADADMTNLTGNLVDAFQAVVSNITPIIENIASAMPEAMGALLDAVVELLPTLIDTAMSLFTQVLDVIVGLLPDLIPVAVQAVMTIVDALIANLPMLIEAGMTLILSLANGLIDALPDLIPVMVDTVLLITDTLIDNIDLLIDAGIEIMLALMDGLIEALPRLLEKAPVIVQKLVDAIVTNAPKLLTAAGELIGKMVVGLIENLPKLLTAAFKIVDSIKTGITDFKDRMADAGTQLIMGLWNGIKDKANWIKEKVKGFGTTVLKAVKGVFGIKSPSKVFRDEIGGNIVLGLNKGLEAGQNLLARTSFETSEVVMNGFDVGSAAYNMETQPETKLLNNQITVNIANGRDVDARKLAQQLQFETERVFAGKGGISYAY